MSQTATPPAATTVSTALRLALLEDDDVLRDRVLVPGLTRHGFDVEPMRTVAQLHAALERGSFDLIVLDIGLPDGDGFSLTRELQAGRPGMGIVILSGRDTSPDKVRGLSQGADAYLTKPVEIEMLAATLFSVARRLTRPEAAPVAGPAEWQLQDDGWCLFSPDGKAVALTQSERRVLLCLWRTRGKLVSRESLLDTLGGDMGLEIDPHRLDALLHRLRQKVQDRAGMALPLTAVRGAGYLFNPQGP
ncbi:DNA-binding response regulator, OmpR family, contains REC and winged-helix (wHTH) domain [Pseudoxanthomonas sp. GM95]|uniref:response regulator transcription factor n=1 Tax=Pseudoxanthomonas sp. GM95 TaxID=1881043 RepID=UPI0008BA74B5|nr:response regulator transcription factor [Pseudoxanthomonas sp. GM95]SEM27266.1 DNA-binding response regulator, OmpR family, contains REC and winged-helix (wHTH) domain [Pseudoxanthomonas sp. GM95]